MSNSFRILVTGGLGTVGAGLISELRKRGHHVVSCDLQHQADEIGFSLRTDVEVPLYARCDVGDFRQLERVFERCGPFDYVYHCAAEFGRWNGEDFYETLWRTNAIGTKYTNQAPMFAKKASFRTSFELSKIFFSFSL